MMSFLSWLYTPLHNTLHGICSLKKNIHSFTENILPIYMNNPCSYPPQHHNNLQHYLNWELRASTTQTDLLPILQCHNICMK